MARGQSRGKLAPPPPAETSTFPWFTGTLLAYSAEVVPIGYVNFEPYLFVYDTYGEYNQHWHGEKVPHILTVSPLLFFQVGLTEYLDFFVFPKVTYNRSRGQSFTGFNDFTMGVDIQLLNQNQETWCPAIKLVLQETFPTGKYQKLNPKKKGTDSIGLGIYETAAGISIGKLFHMYSEHYLNARLNLFGSISTSVHVTGFNSYGGGYGTKGKVGSGASFYTIAGFEYNLTKNWALALDLTYTHFNKSPFSGKRGTLKNGAPATVGLPSSEQITAAPAIEYNFNESLGIIAGVWSTVAGRNTLEFTSGVIAFNWYGHVAK